MIEVVKYSSVNDFGTVINPLIVEGQLHGGVVQGIGQALMEMTVYDAEGQFLTGSFMDYALPRASDTPDVARGQPSGAGDHQRARRQGLRRGRLRRLAHLGDERGRRCARPSSASGTSTCRRRPYRVWRAIQDARRGRARRER